MGAGVVDVPHQRGDEGQRGLLALGGRAGAVQQRVPHHLPADPEGTDPVLEGEPRAGSAHGCHPTEDQVFRSDVAVARQCRQLHPVVLEHLLPNLVEEPFVLQCVRRDLRAHHLDGGLRHLLDPVVDGVQDPPPLPAERFGEWGRAWSRTARHGADRRRPPRAPSTGSA